MRRGFLVLVILTAAFLYGWKHGVTEGGIGRYIEAHPTFYHGDLVLYVGGSFHELINQDEKALGMYQRVVKLYPRSRWEDDAQFGVGASYERLGHRKKAVEEYEIYKAKFPDGRFHRSVSKNIDLLKGY
ncbi:MAG: tetratricopeptide repeat protein [Elusimicrobia bacterium]|nr:tetratricopeptide repeat protein [Elusimicrobiota bacterium]